MDKINQKLWEGLQNSRRRIGRGGTTAVSEEEFKRETKPKQIQPFS